ncbi:MAG: hypothetical protein WAV85_01800 [Rhodoferax sp.]
MVIAQATATHSSTSAGATAKARPHAGHANTLDLVRWGEEDAGDGVGVGVTVSAK